MATMTITLNENDIEEAVDLFLRARGMNIKGKPAVHYDPGDSREPSRTTISADVEMRQTSGDSRDLAR